MRHVLRCDRGSVAFATVVALIPLIGFVALGAEAGSWYVVKQNAQNAADAAAYSSGLTLACANSGSSNCDTAQDYVYRGKQYAAQNAFCNVSGDPTYPGSTCGTLTTGTTRTVSIDRGTYSGGSWTSSASGSFVLASITQRQPGYLASVMGLSTVTIRAQSIVEIKNPKDLCALGLGPASNALTIGGSSIITGSGCGLMSDTSVKYNSTPTFSGSGWAVNAVTGCNASTSHCDIGVPYNYNMLPVANPLLALNSKTFNSRTSPSSKPCTNGIVTNGNTCSLTPNSASGVYSDLKVNAGGTLNLAAGTYFFYNATLDFGGTVTGTDVTLILLGNSKLTINGGSTSLSAPTTNTFDSSLNGVLIDDQATGAVTIGGSGAVQLGGAMYFPNTAVSYGGTTASASTGCAEVIASSLTITGNAYLSTSGCDSGTVTHTQVVALVY